MRIPYTRRRNCICFLTTSTIIFLVYSCLQIIDTNQIFNHSDPEELLCHTVTSKESLPDISDLPPSVNARNIFFLETSCNSYKKGKIFIKARQACAVESAARMNPNMDVYLLYAAPGVIKDENTESDRLLQALKTYPNVKIMHFDVNRYIKDTPVDSLWTTGKIKTSLYPMAHTSDILRLVTLWKFGGIYLDLDVVIVKSLEHLPENFAGAESENMVANGVMGFSKFGMGHDYVTLCMNDIRDNFNGKDWAYNGPRLVTRMLSGQCSKWEVTDMIQYGRCDEFLIFPPSAFYLVPWPQWDWFFKKSLTEVMYSHVMEKSFMIHAWNKLSYNTTIPKYETDVPYLYFATKFCPKVVEGLDEFF